jgi:transposase
MAKFTKETRVEVVMAIASGATIKGAARQYHVGHNQARRWYRAYTAGGLEQVLNTEQHYSGSFKLQAIEYRWQNKLSYPQAAAVLGISNDGLLYAWEKNYLEQGIEGLQDTRKGRPPKVPEPKSPKKNKKPLNREQELEAEITRLRMENAYLKKLNALVAEREKSEKKKK